MPVVLTIRQYVDTVRAEQKTLPRNKRKIVPSVDEIAEATGFHKISTYRFLSPSNKSNVSFPFLGGFIKLFREYGHQTQVSDLLTYVED